MPSRLLRPALLAALLVAALPATAAAAGAALRAPADGVVSGATRLVVQVDTGAAEEIERIEVSLRHREAVEEVGRHVLCDTAETCSRATAGYRIALDPVTGAPFAEAAGALPNGPYLLRLHLLRPGGGMPESLDLGLVLSTPGSAPAGLQAAVDDGEVALDWDAAPEPDVRGYRVERRAGPDWVLLAELPPQATSVTDDPGPGRHAYRVVTLRPDGRGATYETVSQDVSVAVAADAPVGADRADPEPGRTSDGGRPPADDPASESPPPTGRDRPSADAEATAPPAEERPSPQEGPAAPDRSARSWPAPDAVATVTGDGELRLVGRAPRTDDGRSAAVPHRFAAPAVVGLLFVVLAVRVWRWSRRTMARR